jgi:hypothetical protein
MGRYTPKIGYMALCEDWLVEMSCWWWKTIWKYKCPLKSRIFMWLALNNMILTWDQCQRRGKEGPGRCPLCKEAEETSYHLLMTCEYTKLVWKEIGTIMGYNVVWVGATIEEGLKVWMGNKVYDNLKSLPLIVGWGVWLARNVALFEEQSVLALQCATQGLSILKHFP